MELHEKEAEPKSSNMPEMKELYSDLKNKKKNSKIGDNINQKLCRGETIPVNYTYHTLPICFY
jgi:hypothetical protein